MAKDSFFIRASVDGLTGSSFGQTTIDLGAYVDALGSSILRIHRVAVVYNAGGNFGSPTLALANTEGRAAFQLTTQSQSAMVTTTNRSVISTGHLDVANNSATANNFTFASDALDISPQEWTNGYLVAVEQIYLGGSATAFSDPMNIEVTLECTVEKMTSSAAMALALSQQ